MEKELYHNGVLLVRYLLCYPIGEAFAFAKAMSESYAAYLEGEYFEKLVEEYDQDPDRRKRFRYKFVQITQRCKAYQDECVASVYFCVYENEYPYAFAFTFDKVKGIVMTLRDFAVKRKCITVKNRLYYDGDDLYIFSKKGELVEKISDVMKKREK